MTDKYKPFQKIRKENFLFTPTSFKIWMGGNIIKTGKTSSNIVAEKIYENYKDKVEIKFDDSSLNGELSKSNIFDEFITVHDRLQLITIPEKTNNLNNGIETLKAYFGATRESKNFDRNEPYCCNIFTEENIIIKITFSYSNPEKLLELNI